MAAGKIVNLPWSNDIELKWVSRQSAANQYWGSVCYGKDYSNKDIFVAVATTDAGGTNRIMMSRNAIDWTLVQSPIDANWNSVCCARSYIIAVAAKGTKRIIVSVNGSTWVTADNSYNYLWQSVCYGVPYTADRYVAVSSDGQVMTAEGSYPMGWTLQSGIPDNQWNSVCYGNGLFVAVASGGSNSRVMTSPNGIDWTLRQSASDSSAWYSVCYGNGLFVAVSESGTDDKAMISEDGISWTLCKTPNNSWDSVCYGLNTFVAVANSGNGDRVMTANYPD